MSAVTNNGPFFSTAPDTEDEELDLSELIGVIVESRWLILGITIVALVFGGFRAITAVPVYQADGLIQVEQPGQGDFMRNIGPQFRPQC